MGKAYSTNAGSCVVMNVKTGEILAMASYPNYDPADFVGALVQKNGINIIQILQNH